MAVIQRYSNFDQEVVFDVFLTIFNKYSLNRPFPAQNSYLGVTPVIKKCSAWGLDLWKSRGASGRCPFHLRSLGILNIGVHILILERIKVSFLPSFLPSVTH